MSAAVLVLLPHGALPGDVSVGAGCRVVEWHVPDDIVRALSTLDDGIAGVVLMSDGLAADTLARVAAAVEAAGVPVVEVRSQQWDGFSTASLAPVCKGVISGFGIDGARAAAEALQSP